MISLPFPPAEVHGGQPRPEGAAGEDQSADSQRRLRALRPLRYQDGLSRLRPWRVWTSWYEFEGGKGELFIGKIYK